MDANPYDKFDQPAAAPVASSNPYDQFDEGAAPPKPPGLWSDVKNLFGIGVDTAAQDFRELARKALPETVFNGLDEIDKWRTGKSSEELLKGEIERKQKALSPEQQAANEKLWWDEKTNWFGPAVTDPRSYLGGVVQSIPETAITMVPSVALAKGAYAIKLAGELGKGVVEAEAKKAAAAAAAKTAYLAGAAGEGSLAGAQSSRQVRDEILAIPEDVLQKSDAYRSLLESGLSPERAKLSLADDASTKAFVLAGITTGMFGGAGDAFLARAWTQGIKGGLVKRIVKGMISEGVLEEFPQSYLQQVSENIAKQPALPDTKLTAGALNQGFQGLGTGMVMGGGFGAVSRPASTEAPTAPTPIPAEPSSPIAPILDATTIDEAITATNVALSEPLPSAPPQVNIAPQDVERGQADVEAELRAAIAGNAPEAYQNLMEVYTQSFGIDAATALDTRLRDETLAATPPQSEPAATTPVAAQPTIPSEPAAGVPAAPPAAVVAAPPVTEAPQFEDFSRRSDGAVKTFGSEQDAALYQRQRSNRVPGNMVPRQTESGWRLSRAAATAPSPAVAKPEVAPKPVKQPVQIAATRQVERRGDVATRKKVADMTPDERATALLTSELTGLRNRRAYDEAPRRAVQASLDVDGLKWVNDSLGHGAGDNLLRAVGEAVRDEGLDGYHLSGDEFAAQFDDEAGGHAALARVRARLAGATVTAIAPDGSKVTKKGIGFSYGLGKDLSTADTGLQRDKLKREASGERTARGAEPAGVGREPAVQAGKARSEAPAQVAPNLEPRSAAVSTQPAEQGPAAATEAPTKVGVSASGPSIADVPPGMLRKITVPVEQHHEGEGVKTVQVTAAEALADNQAEISAYERLLACVKAA